MKQSLHHDCVWAVWQFFVITKDQSLDVFHWKKRGQLPPNLMLKALHSRHVSALHMQR
jgi:hypothetical protein